MKKYRFTDDVECISGEPEDKMAELEDENEYLEERGKQYREEILRYQIDLSDTAKRVEKQAAEIVRLNERIEVLKAGLIEAYEKAQLLEGKAAYWQRQAETLQRKYCSVEESFEMLVVEVAMTYNLDRDDGDPEMSIDEMRPIMYEKFVLGGAANARS